MCDMSNHRLWLVMFCFRRVAVWCATFYVNFIQLISRMCAMLCWRFSNFPIHQTMEREEKSWKHFVKLNREQSTRKWGKQRNEYVILITYVELETHSAADVDFDFRTYIFIEHQNSRSSWELEKSRALLCRIHLRRIIVIDSHFRHATSFCLFPSLFYFMPFFCLIRSLWVWLGLERQEEEVRLRFLSLYTHNTQSKCYKVSFYDSRENPQLAVTSWRMSSEIHSIVRDKRDNQNSIVQLNRQFFQSSSLDHQPLHSHAINLTPIKWTRDIDKSFRHWWRDRFMKLKLITLAKDTKVKSLNLNFLTPVRRSGDNVVSPCGKYSLQRRVREKCVRVYASLLKWSQARFN